MEYYHVDVFSKVQLAGNGLTVFLIDEDLSAEYMLKLAQEFKQFETIFIRRSADAFRAHIFTVDEELDFAGHPILGGAAIIHQRYFKENEQASIKFILNHKEVVVDSTRENDCFCCQMNQGKPEFLGVIENELYDEYLKPLSLSKENLADGYPLEVVSTGLPYLLIPVQSGLENAKIITNDLRKRLVKINAKFIYIFDVNKMEGRTWDNLGNAEDVATGSAAGPVGAYLIAHNKRNMNQEIILHQGIFLNRPSEIVIYEKAETQEIMVRGYVSVLAKGEFLKESIYHND